MTLIFSHRSPVTGLYTLSDTVVSNLQEYAPGAIQLPFREGPLNHHAHGYALAGLRQKTTIANRTMLMWAGSELGALVLFKQILKMSNDGADQINLDDAVSASGLSDKELSEVSLIYHFCLGPNEVHISSWDCKVLEEPGAHHLVGTGSGVEYFFKTLSLSGYDGPEYERVLQAFRSKVVSHALYEGESTASLDHLYGGWFELAYKTAEGFNKVPYAIKRWARHDGLLASGGPTLFGWYSGPNLIVTRHQPVEETVGVVSHKFRHTVVPDFLKRAGKLVPPENPIRPYFVGHLVHDYDLKTTFALIEDDPSPDEMLVESNEERVRISWTNKLRERLLNLESDLGVTLSDQPL